MGKRKREEDDDYVDFCSGLQETTRDGRGERSYIYSTSRPYKRPKINPNFYTPARVAYRYLGEEEIMYKEIKRLITNDSIVVDEIMEVKNSVLEDAYYSKKTQKMRQYGNQLTEALLFHGTKDSKVNSICKFNFDWRLNGSNKGHKFGKGVCFSTNAKYASNYSDSRSYYKVMIVAKVLIANVCQGNHDMSIPPPGYDTSQKGDNGVVIVKYEDNEFFPAYVLHYHFRDNYEDDYYSRSYYNRRSNDYYNSDHYYDNMNYDSGYGYYSNDHSNSDSYCNDYYYGSYNNQFYNSQNYTSFHDSYEDHNGYYY